MMNYRGSTAEANAYKPSDMQNCAVAPPSPPTIRSEIEQIYALLDQLESACCLAANIENGLWGPTPANDDGSKNTTPIPQGVINELGQQRQRLRILVDVIYPSLSRISISIG